MVDLANEKRAELLESVAEADEDLMNEFFENGDLSEEQIKKGLRILTLQNEIIPDNTEGSPWTGHISKMFSRGFAINFTFE